jgi:polysaccharide biosynthesis protein PslG
VRRRDCLGVVVTSTCLPGLAAAAPAETFLYGLGLSINDKPMTRAVQLAAGLGANSIRIDAHWGRIEGADGELRVPVELDELVNACLAAKVAPLLILAYGHPRYGGDKPLSDVAVQAFARYAAFVARHFQGKVAMYDVWNEWNTHTGRTRPGTADDYVKLAQAVYKAVKAVDSKIRLLSGGISDLGLGNGWLERFLEMGGHRWVDGMSIHPYNWFYRAKRTPEAAIDIIDGVVAQLDAVGASQMPVYVTEIGWPNFSGKHGRTGAEVESYLSRFMLLAASRPRVAGVWWYCLRDQGRDAGNKEHRFGLLDFDYDRKPIAARFEQLGALLRSQGRPAAQADGSNYRVRWKNNAMPAITWRPQEETAVPLSGLDGASR